jgi:hypothetical protein
MTQAIARAILGPKKLKIYILSLQGEKIVKSTLFCKVCYVLFSDIKFNLELHCLQPAPRVLSAGAAAEQPGADAQVLVHPLLPGTHFLLPENSRDGVFKLISSPGIDSKESILPAYVAWRAGTTTLIDCSKIPALDLI